MPALKDPTVGGSQVPLKEVVVYKRVSTGKQAEADKSGLERQDDAVRAWLARHPDYLLREERIDAMSGRGAHRKRGELGRFIAEAKAGKWAEGTVLLVESSSRLSREGATQSFSLILNDIFSRGLSIAICDIASGAILSDLESNAVYELFGMARAAKGESDEKRNRARAAAKKRRARLEAGEKPFNPRESESKATNYPFWLSWNGNSFDLNKHAEWVEQIFDLITQMGTGKIAKRLIAMGIKPATNPNGVITAQSLIKILKDRRVLGEKEIWETDPKDGRSKPSGLYIKNVFPKIISSAKFVAAQEAIAGRLTHRSGNSRAGQNIHNLFQGHIFCAKCGGLAGIRSQPTYAVKEGTKKTYYYLRCLNAAKGVCDVKTLKYGLMKSAKNGEVLERDMYGELAVLERIQSFRWADYFADSQHEMNLRKAQASVLAAEQEKDRLLQQKDQMDQQVLANLDRPNLRDVFERQLGTINQQLDEAQAKLNLATAELERLSVRKSGKAAAREVQRRLTEFIASDRLDPLERDEFGGFLAAERLKIAVDFERGAIHVGIGDTTDGKLLELDERLEDLVGLGMAPDEARAVLAPSQR